MNLPLNSFAIQGQAKSYLYYNGETGNWNSLSRLESTLRSIFFLFVDSAEMACEKRSWKAIQLLPSIPESITVEIDDVFEESRDRFHRSNHLAKIITDVFIKVYQEKHKDKAESFPMNLFIHEDTKQRLFHVNATNYGSNRAVVSSDYAKLDFYKGNNQVFTNKHDDLMVTGEDKVKARIKLVSYVPKEGSSSQTYYEIYEGDAQKRLFKMGKEGDDSTFVVRDSLSDQIVAIAKWSKSKFQLWSVAITKPDFWSKEEIPSFFKKGEPSSLDFLVLAMMKHSQRYMGDKPYVSNYGHASTSEQ